MSQIISSASKDCINTEKYDLSGDMGISDDRKDVSSDESNLGLFRKCVLNKGQQSKGKRVEEEASESIRNQLRFSGMHPQQFAYTSRPSTLLEKHLLPVLESSAKLPTSSADLPLARTISLQHFLEKRRKRIMNKSPYPAPCSSTTQPDVDKELTQMKLNLNNIGESNEEKSLSNFPFPSRGYFFPISTNKRC
ncbi:hypothetical protein AgCh_021571 [Apium graveolens]